MFTRISPGCFIELHLFGQLCENIPDRTSSIITKHEAFHHVHQPATHSKKPRFKLENQGSFIYGTVGRIKNSRMF